jgi:hypothetical protein
MIRFRCPSCARGIKVPEDKAGRRIRCPRCKEHCQVPVEDPDEGSSSVSSSLEAAELRQRGQHPASAWGHVRALFGSMPWWLRGVVALVATAAVGSVAVVSLGSLLPHGQEATPWAMLGIPVSVILLSVILHGHATGCRACGRWWARRSVDTDFVGRHVFDKGGVPYARATYRTTYECTSCRHRWTVDHSDEYKDFIRGDPKKRPPLI